MLSDDPLRIHYLTVLADDAADTSPLQGFGRSWGPLSWAFVRLATMPADVLEPSSPIDALVSQRMGGWRQISWIPINIETLESLLARDLGMFVVLMSAHPEASSRASSWIEREGRPVLHVTTEPLPGTVTPDAFDLNRLRAYCEVVIKALGENELDEERLGATRAALQSWDELPRRVCENNVSYAHNITFPNHQTLRRAGYEVGQLKPFVGRSETEYSRLAVDSAETVESVRQRAELGIFHRMSLLHPSIFLAEPALYRYAYKPIRLGSPKHDDTGGRMLRYLQQQKGLHLEIPKKIAEELLRSPSAKSVVEVRQKDLEIFTAAIALRAAQTTSAVLRLSPGVNHVFAAQSNLARSLRSNAPASKLKIPRLFAQIQRQIADAIGSERIQAIKRIPGAIKIISDAPIEWMPYDGLPLLLKRDCSRINSTPGNLLLGQLAQNDSFTVAPVDLCRVLVLSALGDDDPLRDMLIDSLKVVRPRWQGKVVVDFKRVASKAEFVEALNASKASILIFDGHGVENTDEFVGKLRLGEELIDVWSLRGLARVPPITMLSACDTQGIDASSHATVANGFLALGAHTVLATLLPIDGRSAASFMARLVYRLADFIPAALSARKRVLNWTEVVSGMQRMVFASELLDEFFKRRPESVQARLELQMKTNMEINTGCPTWFENVLDEVALQHGKDTDEVLRRAQRVIARSEAIRYIQLGNPENILIDDGSVRSDVFAISGYRPVKSAGHASDQVR